MPPNADRARERNVVDRLKTFGLVVLALAVGVLGARDLQRRREPRPPAEPPAAVALSGTAENVFDRIYRDRIWGTNERGVGRSGFGSTLEFTKFYRVFLQDFLAAHDIRTVVDAGCGDWEFSREIDWSGIDYLGCDIVESVIAENTRRHGAPNIHFVACDITATDLPRADLLIVKDVLQHLSNQDIERFLEQLEKYEHVLIINDVDPDTFSASNQDIRTGEYRPLDLTRPPFDLPMTKLFAWHHGGYTKLVLHRQR